MLSCTEHILDGQYFPRRYIRLQLDSNNRRLSSNSLGSNLLELQYPWASFVLLIYWCTVGDSHHRLTCVCTWSLQGLSCRYWIASTENNLKESPLLNLRINNQGDIVHLRWHNTNNKCAIYSTIVPSNKYGLMQQEHVRGIFSYGSIGLPCPWLIIIVCQHNYSV